MIMAIITPIELFRILIMSIGVGVIFSFSIEKRHNKPIDVLDEYKKSSKLGGLDIDTIIFAAIIAAPGIIFHELAHKFVAMSFGLNATFYAAYTFLAFAIILALVGFPLLFFVPGYVSIIGAGTYLQYALIAFAGPFFNLVTFCVSWIVLKNYKSLKLSKNALYGWTICKKMNLFLFVFNLLPIPGFDGWSVFYNLFKIFF